MAEFFDVQYNIDVFSEPAVRGIDNFVNAVNNLSGVSTKLQNFQNTLRQIETMSTKGLALNIKVEGAMAQLKRVQNRLKDIQKKASSINLGVQGTVANPTTSHYNTNPKKTFIMIFRYQAGSGQIPW